MGFLRTAGYSKTTVSWGLYKYALFDNLQHALNTGKSEWLRVGRFESHGVRYWTPCYVYHEAVPEWIEKIQASWDEESRTAPPALSFDKLERARREGFTPRV